MFKILAAPSPRGTNKEKNVCSGQSLWRRIAYDEAPPKKRGDVMTLLRTIARMTPENWLQLQRVLLGYEAEDVERINSPEERQYKESYGTRMKSDPEEANDEPLKFKGRPRPGGAMDGSSNFFNEMYPGAIDIKLNGASDGLRKRAKAKPPTASRSFDEMFPDAAKIKVYR